MDSTKIGKGSSQCKTVVVEGIQGVLSSFGGVCSWDFAKAEFTRLLYSSTSTWPKLKIKHPN